MWQEKTAPKNVSIIGLLSCTEQPVMNVSMYIKGVSQSREIVFGFLLRSRRMEKWPCMRIYWRSKYSRVNLLSYTQKTHRIKWTESRECVPLSDLHGCSRKLQISIIPDGNTFLYSYNTFNSLMLYIIGLISNSAISWRCSQFPPGCQEEWSKQNVNISDIFNSEMYSLFFKSIQSLSWQTNLSIFYYISPNVKSVWPSMAIFIKLYIQLLLFFYICYSLDVHSIHRGICG